MNIKPIDRKILIYFYIGTYFQPMYHFIGLWCNGSTSDSGSGILSSNLGSPTETNWKIMFGDWKNLLKESRILPYQESEHKDKLIEFPKCLSASDILKMRMDSLNPELKKWKFKPGQIIRIKKGSRVWLICLQSNIIFDEEETYIQLTSIAYDKSVAFGYKVEKNMFGPLKWDNEHDEIMVACESLDLSETYTEKNFCNDRFFWMDYVYTGENNKMAGAEHTPD